MVGLVSLARRLVDARLRRRDLGCETMAKVVSSQLMAKPTQAL
jgi:hypothetical protein